MEFLVGKQNSCVSQTVEILFLFALNISKLKLSGLPVLCIIADFGAQLHAVLQNEVSPAVVPHFGLERSFHVPSCLGLQFSTHFHCKSS